MNSRSQVRMAIPAARGAAAVVALFKPKPIFATLLLGNESNADAEYLIRIVESRGLVVSALTAGIAGPTSVPIAMRCAAAMDAVDAVSGYLAYRQGRVGKGVLAYYVALGGTLSVLGLWASRGSTGVT